MGKGCRGVKRGLHPGAVLGWAGEEGARKRKRQLIAVAARRKYGWWRVDMLDRTNGFISGSCGVHRTDKWDAVLVFTRPPLSSTVQDNTPRTV